jgi:serine/threonine protein kinase
MPWPPFAPAGPIRRVFVPRLQSPASMSSSSPFLGPLSDLVARCVLAYERDGDPAVELELEAYPALAAEARQQLASLEQAGLLSLPTPPERFGPYRVVRRLGSGGMGTVWLCLQDQPIQREVAIKVMRPGLDHAELLARFQVERQAMAMLTDPCIARVLDSGLTTDRRPYLVMDYVPGVAITQFCDARRMSVQQRLALFAQVCDAVQHAHHKGIVHRDLKPSNVLVMERDGEPLPVIIDFGVAKSVTGAVQGMTLHTLPGRLLGTPEYMSPEQARSDLDIDTRTDVYSLGVLLYELLTGCLPLASDQLRNLADLGRVIGEVEPMRASARVAGLTDAERQQRAECRRSSQLAMLRALRGELEWITGRAMEKRRDRRYSTATDFAQDVRRYLAKEPISAGPPSRWYALRKFCLRHRLPVATLAGTGMLLAAMTAISVWFWRDASAAERTALASNERLEQNLDSALMALDRMVALGADGLRTPANEPMRRALLAMALDLHEQLSSGGAPAPRLTAALASALARSAELHQDLGETRQAGQQLERAEQALQTLGETLPAAASLNVGRARLLCGRLRKMQGALDRARQHFEAAWASCKHGDASLLYLEDLEATQLAAMRELADLDTATDTDAARDMLRAALPLADALLANNATTIESRATALLTITRLAWLESESRDPKDALLLLTRALQFIEAECAKTSELPHRLPLTPALQQISSASLRMHAGDLAQRALTPLQSTLREAIQAEPTVPSHRMDLSKALMCQSLLVDDRLPPAQILAMEEEALQLEEQAIPELGNSPELRVVLLGDLLDFAMRRLDWYEGESYRAAVDLDRVALRMAAAATIWNDLPEAYRRDRHPRESWFGSFILRVTLARIRSDVAAARAAQSEGLAFADALLRDHPDVVQTRLMRADLNLTSALAELSGGDPRKAWTAHLAQLEDLRISAPAFASRARWPRLGERLPRTKMLLRSLLALAADPFLARQAATELVGLATAADQATNGAAALELRLGAVECLAAAKANGLPTAELAAAEFDSLRSLPAFLRLTR